MTGLWNLIIVGILVIPFACMCAVGIIRDNARMRRDKEAELYKNGPFYAVGGKYEV